MKVGARRRAGAVALLAGAVLGAACPVGPGVRGRVDVAPPGAPAVRFTYLGVGGWLVERNGSAVLGAPLFSNPGLVRTGLASVRADTAAIDAALADLDLTGVRAILVGHGHYDHLMDVPRVARAHAPGARILGSRTVRNLLGSWSGVGERVVVVDSLAGDADRVGRWIDAGGGVRVMALRSHHAPHFDGYTLYHGTVDRPLAREPRWAKEWLDGPTFAFLVDFLEADGTVAFRVYVQDAVAAAPLGFAPRALMEERGADVAILVPATFDQVEWHPEAFVENLQPRWVLLGHWENFFVPPATPPRSIMMTDMGHFEARLRRVHGDAFWRPAAGTVFRFPAGARRAGADTGR